MAEQPNISQILAALSQRPSATPPQPQHPLPQPPPQQHAVHSHPPPGYPPISYPPSYPPAGPPVAAVSYNIPQPISSGSIDISNIKPINSGSVAIQDAVARARGIAAEKGIGHWTMRGNGTPGRDNDPRLAGGNYQRSRSRSRSPIRLTQGFHDGYNPYRDERRDDTRRPVIMPYGRERTFSPDIRGAIPGARFTPPVGQTYGGPYDRPPMSHASGDTNTETIPIESGVVGLIIGRQGENLRRVEAETGTRVQFMTGPETVGPMRECKITGPKAAREAAKEEIFRVIEENGNPPSASGRAPLPPGRDMGLGAKNGNQHQPALRAGEESSQIMVPNRTVGLIIGRGGETIRDLQERSGCHVNIVGEDKSINGLRPVNLIGTAYTSGLAKDLIMEIVESDTKSLANQGANGAPRTQPNTLAFGADGEKINDIIMVPSEAVGMIIGKGGETIKNMQVETGCKINVSPASGQDVEREIGLIGSRDSIERAKGAIMEKVHAVQEKNSRPGNTGRRDDSQYSQQPQTFSGSNQHPLGQRNGQVQSQPPAANPDPYAAYGGYENYVALWYSSQMQQQQQAQQNPQGPPTA